LFAGAAALTTPANKNIASEFTNNARLSIFKFSVKMNTRSFAIAQDDTPVNCHSEA